MRPRIAVSARPEESIEALLVDGLTDSDQLTQLRLELILQRSIEDELAAFLGRARYQRTAAATGSRNGHRPRRVQTAEGEISVAVPQVRGSLARFVSSVIPNMRTIMRTRPLEALVIGAYVRGLSDRDIESLAREAGLGNLSRSSISRLCHELRDRYRAFRARSLAGVELLTLFLDAIYLPTRPEGPREGVLVAWGFTLAGERVLLDVCLGQRERHDDWLELGRWLTRRGLPEPLLVVSDGAPAPIASAVACIASGTSWPSCPRTARCTTASARPTGPRSTRPTARRRPAWPTTCRR